MEGEEEEEEGEKEVQEAAAAAAAAATQIGWREERSSSRPFEPPASPAWTAAMDSKGSNSTTDASLCRPTSPAASTTTHKPTRKGGINFFLKKKHTHTHTPTNKERGT